MICVEIDLIFAERTYRVAIAIAVSGYPVCADHTRRSTVAIAVSAYVFAADRTRRVAVSIAVKIYAVTADRACRVARSICEKDRYAAERIVVWGESLGTDVAVGLASKHPVGRLMGWRVLVV